uniref:DDE_Tnp_1_7 domain-containing protein n=1 Tax=Strongyloides stercoralis TaxID=6248 RepID=A0A0K0ELN5_STRER
MKKEKKTNDCKWSKVDPVFRKWNVGCNLEEFTKDKINIEAFKDLNPVEIYEKFLDDSTIKYIVEQTLLYAVQNNRHDFTVNEEEIRTFIAILFLSGYHQLPQERMYWCNEEDLGLEIVSKAMPRNKYDQIKQNIHFVDNSKIDTTDKMFKLRPLMNILNEKFKQWGIFHTYLSIDEAMVRYFGRHSAKQFIRGKPTRFGYKNWVLASFDGYCYHFDTYCGKNKMENVSVSLGSNVVLNLLENIENPSNHAVFFDNYFSTLHLMSTLTNRGFRATATIRKNRISKCPLKSSKILSKQPRGNFDFQFDTSHDLLVVRWVDNNVVNMITNYDTIQPLHKVKRWSRKDKKVTEVSQPQLFNTYNKRMGGVDLSDLSVNTYRISIRGKKWWWVLFTYMLDLSLTNAWKLYQLSSGKKITQLEFTRYIVRHYLFRANKTQRRQSSLPLGVQFDNLGHFPQRIDNPLRCRVCHSRIRWICKKCKHTLCVEKNCFELYHTP